jgi:ABC transporter substrate binding protein (PQQ-dependent alcohol dehydrogenase system)
MVSQDWAAWLSVKTIATLLTKVSQRSIAEQADALRSTIAVDGYKGPRLSFRVWNGQLRQPVFITHADGVIAAAPAEGVLHPTETMDTLGFDQPESACKLQP